MNEQIVKTGEGYLRGVSNKSDQPGKKLTLSDGETVLCVLPLDTAFPDRVVVEDGVAGNTVPGMILDLVFTQDLRMKTDGQGLSVYWQ